MMRVVRRALWPLSSAVLAALGSAAASGLLAADAAAQIAVRRDEDDDSPPPLLVVSSNAAPPILLAGHSSHRSHSSHQSHSSHYSSSGGSRSSPSRGDESALPRDSPPPPPPPPPPKPAHVSVVVYPGGQIFVDDKPMGHDQTSILTLAPGSYRVRVVNRFFGESTTTIVVGEGQTGAISIRW